MSLMPFLFTVYLRRIWYVMIISVDLIGFYCIIELIKLLIEAFYTIDMLGEQVKD